MAAKLNERTEVSIPLKNLIGIVIAATLATMGYFGITERINFLEHELEMAVVEIEENDKWIDDFEPPEEVRSTVKRVRELEVKIKEIEMNFLYMKQMYDRIAELELRRGKLRR